MTGPDTGSPPSGPGLSRSDRTLLNIFIALPIALGMVLVAVVFTGSGAL